MPVVGAPATTSSVILDPVTEDATNVELDISSGNYGLTAHSYPTPSVIAQWASSVSTEGARLGTKRHDNRQISITVEVNGLGALQDLEAKLAKLYREGGTLKRIYTDGREIVFDVLVMDGYEPTFDITHHLGDVTTVQFTLTCAPYGRQPEIALSDHVETTLPVLVFTEASIPGDMPALGRLVIDNDAATAQGLLVWGVQSRYTDTTSTGALFYEAEACLIGTATAAAGPAGASGSGNNVARMTTLSATSWTSLISIGSGFTSHVGSFRVFARVQVPITNAGTVSLRTAWSGTIAGPTAYNDAVALELNGGTSWVEGYWTLIDLGVVTIRPAIVGSQGWHGEIQGTSTVGGDDIDIDWLALIPVDEGDGQAVQTSATGNAPLLANGSFQVAHNGVAATTAAPGYWRDPDSYEGFYLFIPPTGAEGRTARVIVKLARNSITVGAVTGPQPGPIFGDSAIDDLSARLYVTPRYLVVPEP